MTQEQYEFSVERLRVLEVKLSAWLDVEDPKRLELENQVKALKMMLEKLKPSCDGE